MKVNSVKVLFVAILLLLTASRFSHAQFIQNNGLAIRNSATITTNGDWTNASGTTILNNGDIKTTASFTNAGIMDPVSSGGFHLSYATNLNFSVNGRMGYLVKDGPGQALVTGNIIVKDSLLLKQGLLVMQNATDTVYAAGNSAVSGGPGSYVSGGVFANSGQRHFFFPIGRDGRYLPLVIYYGSAARASAAVVPIPGGAKAGSGVDSLINFPYAWRVNEKQASDTAAYVEVSYPATLPTVINPIIVRDRGANTFNSMGARLTTNISGVVTVRSYTRALNGLFTVAGGFPIDVKADSLVLVSLFDKTGGANWTTKTNWKTGKLETWSGLTRTGQTITGINLAGNNLAGPVPAELLDIAGLETVNLSNNKITSVPDFRLSTRISSLNVAGNNLTFASLEPNAEVPGFVYNNQAAFGTARNEEVAVNSSVNLQLSAGGTHTAYQWKRNGANISGATSTLYAIPAISRSTMGNYQLEATNPKLPGLTLRSEIQSVVAYADLRGTLFASQNIPATEGKMTLLRIRPDAYDTTGIASIGANGSFEFLKVILDDYKLAGFADTLAHQGALPTYYKNTIFWEEADTLGVENNIFSLNVTSVNKPTPSAGKGVISGYLEEDDGNGRTKETQKNKRVGGAGVSARRVENTGRAKEEVLTLVAYVFTNDDGEFSLTNLPPGTYRLNIQYPGYPMDSTSFINIDIADALKSQVQVAAKVVDGQIAVRKLLITNIFEQQGYQAEVFPNPAVDFVHIKFGNTRADRVVKIHDFNGKLVSIQAAGKVEHQFSVQALSRGIYFLSVIEDGIAVKTLRISIE